MLVRLFSSAQVAGWPFLLCLLLLPTLVWSQTVYVSTTGTNADPTTAISWNSALAPAALPSALTAASSGTIFYVAGGLYTPTSTTSRTASFIIASGVQVYGGYVGSGSPGPRIAYPSIGAPTGTTLSGEIGDPASTTDNSYHVVQFKNASASTRLDGVVITRGRADGGSLLDERGGGVFNDGSGLGNQSMPLLVNVSFSQNYAAQLGGAMFNYGDYFGDSSPVLTNTSFIQNVANRGGAIYNYGYTNGTSSPVLTNVIFSQNSANDGGAMYNIGLGGGDSSPVLTNVSFSQNSATYGGAMYNTAYNGTSRPVLTNCVVFGNTNTFFNIDGVTVTASYSLFDGGSFISGPGNLSTTTSPFVDAPAGNLQLRAGAEAIDAGTSSASVLAGITTDLAGSPRIQGCRIDMGAYESPYSIAPNPTVFTQSTPEGFVVQLTDGVQYERVVLLDRINGYQIQGSEINSTGYFLITQSGPYQITVIGANGCRAVVTGVAP